ncbi:MFS transporter [Ferrovibrio sp.]|uniref:MFS transporter n=1 Tax=Ferrovibrio sp. TaxID=1917215 RepID=UPI003D2C9800
MTPRRLILLLSALGVFGILPNSSFPALVPDFIAAWGLSNAEAGWIAGMYYLGYMACVATAMLLTDRIDAKWVFLTGCVLAGGSTIIYAAIADGFCSAMLLRGIAGIGHAAIYMPGLRALTDRLNLLPGGSGPALQSRAVTLYTACYSVSIAASFTLTGLLAEWFGWRVSFAVVGALALLPAVVTWLVLSDLPPPKTEGKPRLDWRPVFRNRAALGYIVAYGAHGFELMAMRTWLTAFLVFALAREAANAPSWLPGPTLLAAFVTLIGLPASLLGNEVALKVGRRRALMVIMGISALMGIAYGFVSALPVLWLLLYMCVYFIFICGDSGSLTAGMMAAADPASRGATMAVHSIFGFGASVLGPLCVGLALDAVFPVFGQGVLSWGLGLAVMGFGAGLGPLALWWWAREKAPN